MQYLVDCKNVILKGYMVNFVLPILILLFVIWRLSSLLLERKKKVKNELRTVKEKKKSFIIELIFYAFVAIGCVITMCPFALDLPRAINEDYYEADVVLLRDYTVPQSHSPHDSWALKVKDIDNNDEFIIMAFPLKTNLKAGQILHIKILPHSKYGGLAVYE